MKHVMEQYEDRSKDFPIWLSWWTSIAHNNQVFWCEQHSTKGVHSHHSQPYMRNTRWSTFLLDNFWSIASVVFLVSFTFSKFSLYSRARYWEKVSSWKRTTVFTCWLIRQGFPNLSSSIPSKTRASTCQSMKSAAPCMKLAFLSERCWYQTKIDILPFTLVSRISGISRIKSDSL